MKRVLVLVAVGMAVVASSISAWDVAPPVPKAVEPPTAVSPPATVPPQAIEVTPAAPVQPVSPAEPAGAVRAETRGPAFFFKTHRTDQDKPQPEICLTFSRPLDGSGKTAYGDYVRLEPAVKPSVRVNGETLCLGGLAFASSYRVTLLAGLPAAGGAKLANDTPVTVSFADRAVSATFVGSGHVLPRGATTGLTVQTVNLDKVQVKVYRIGERLLSREWKGLIGGGTLYQYRAESLAEQQGALVWSGELEIANKRNEAVTTVFPLAKAIPERRPGAYVVVLDWKTRDSDRDYRSLPYQLVVDTDLALTSFKGGDGLRVFVRSLATAAPAPGIRMSLVAVNNEILGEATTGADGGAAFPAGLLEGKGGMAPASVAAFGPDGDFVLGNLGKAAFDLSDRGVSGRESPGPADAFLYTDRGIYRPGETVHMGLLLRDSGTLAMEGQKVVLVVRRPNGTEFMRRGIETQGAGSLLADIDLPKEASRGLWSIAAHLDPKGPPVGRTQVDVQDFVPQRLKVIASSPAKVAVPGQNLAVEMDGMFLYGAPAADLAAEARVSLRPDPAPFPDYKAYRFGLVDDSFKSEEFTLSMPATDAQGKTRGEGKVPEVSTSLPLRAEVTAGLVEPGGRLTSSRFSLPVRSPGLLLGIKPLFKDGRVKEGEEARFDVVALDGDGKPVAAPGLRFRIIEVDYHYIWSESRGRWAHERSRRTHEIASGTFDLQAGQPARLAHKTRWEDYELVVETPDGKATTSIAFRGGWGRTEGMAEVPDKLEVTIEKAAYKPGEKAKLNIRPPFPGKALVVVASDRVFETQVFDLPEGGVDISVPVRAEWGSGAYVMATLVRPLNGLRPRDPVRAVGLAWVGLDSADRTLSLDLGAPEKMTPRQSLELPVKVTGIPAGEPAFLTVAAVDEGILQLTRFRTPDPLDHYFGKRRLGVEMRDDYGALLRDGTTAPGTIRSGGDSDAGGVGGKGLPVVPTKSVALFSGLVKVDEKGLAKVSLPVPDFSGRLRLMAVAHSRTAIGKAEAFVTVRDPVVADVSLPRFLAPGDEGRLTLLVHNVEGPAGAYRVDLSASGAVELAGEGALRYDLAKDGRKIETIPVKAPRGGIGTVALRVTGPKGWSVERSWSIVVRSPHYPVTLEKVALQQKGETFKVDPALVVPFEPGSAEVTVNYGGLQGFNVPSILQSLNRYPYGCTEQRVSTAYPLLFFNDPALINAKAAKGDATIRERVQDAAYTIMERQEENGTIGLWRTGDGNASPYVEAYAIDFLLKARSLGYSVPDSTARAALGRLEALASHYNTDGEDKAYIEYLLAREGVGDIGRLRVLADSQLDSLRGGLSAAQVGAALAMRGDRIRAGRAFERARSNVGGDPRYWPSLGSGRHYYYGSWRRDFAGVLALAAEAKQDDVVSGLLERLGSIATGDAYLNTQEKAWMLRAAAALAGGETGSLAVTGYQPAALKVTNLPASLKPTTAQIEAGFAVANAGDKAIWRSLVIHGAPIDPPPPLAEGFTIEKRLFTLSGEALDPLGLHQNDRFIVSLKGRSTDGFDHQAVLADLLPAGWEIEAAIFPDKDGDSAYMFLGKLTPARLREARDDRFVAAFKLAAAHYRHDADMRDFHLAYMVRAVTPGRFVLPGVVIEDMYRPNLMARTAAGQAEVKAP